MRRELTLLAVAFATFSCAEATVNESTKPQTESKTVSVEVGISAEAITKVSLSEEGEVWHAAWSEGDALGGWSTGESSTNEFTMKGDYIDETVTFEGEMSGDDLRLVYPYSDDAAVANGMYTIDVSEQSVDLSAAAIESMGSDTYMVSSELLTEVDGTSVQSYMMHATAAVEFELAFVDLPADAITTIDYLYFGCDANGDNADYAPSKAIIDLSKSGVEYGSVADDTEAIKVSVENCAALVEYTGEESEIVSLAFNVIPFSVKAGAPLDILIALNHEVGGETTTSTHIVTITNEGNESFEFGRATHSTVKAVCSCADEGDADDTDEWRQDMLVDFEDGTNPGNIGTNAATTAMTAKGEGCNSDYAVIITNAEVMTNDYEAQFSFYLPDPTGCAAGDEVIVEFDIRSDNATAINNAQLGLSVDPYYLCSIGPGVIETTTEWSHVKFSFILSGDNYYFTTVGFNIGLVADSFYLDNVSVKSRTPVSTGLLAGGDFETGSLSANFFTGGTTVSEVIEEGDGNHVWKYSNSTIGDEDWNAQIFFSLNEGEEFEVGKNYSVSFKIKSEAGIQMTGTQLQSLSGTYLETINDAWSIPTTTAWTNVTFVFSPTEEGATKIAFCFGNVAETYYIDDCQIAAIE